MAHIPLSRITDLFLVKDQQGNWMVLKKGAAVPDVRTGEEGVSEEPQEKKQELSEDAPFSPVFLPAEKGKSKGAAVPDRVTRREGPAFYFSVEDEEEVSAFRKKLAQATHMASLVDAAAERVIGEFAKRHGREFSGETLGRLKRVLASRLRGIRDLVAVKEVLTRSPDAGGVGLSSDDAASMIQLAEEERQRVESGSVPEQSGGQEPQARKEADFGGEEKKEEGEKGAGQGKEIGKEKPGGGKEEKQERQETPAPVPRIQRPLASDKTVMEDVKRARKVTGPLEELSQLTVPEWRRYGANTQERIQKVREKIDFMAEDSLKKRAEAIRAWRSSPLYRRYLSLGKEAVERSKPMEELLKEKEGDVLTLEEFNAISDFNRSLSF